MLSSLQQRHSDVSGTFHDKAMAPLHPEVSGAFFVYIRKEREVRIDRKCKNELSWMWY
jgi:hypothetical protein